MAGRRGNAVNNAPKLDALDGGIGPIEVPKASDVLAARLREQILQGKLPEGQPLPAERELTIQTGLGRSSIREALRILEHQGFIVTRPGRNGGSIVRLPPRESVEASLGNFIRGQQLRMMSLLETRQALEPAAARLAARHRDPVDLARIDAIARRHEIAFDDVPRFLEANVQWHLAIVAASHNELLIAFMTAISQAVHAATDIENFNSDEVRRRTLQIHRRVVDAIRDRDEDAAERRMRRHVAAYVDLVGATAPAVLEQATRLE
jgi:GntR family transcriptional regulator, transcriptional repressor for pyruvate dehydrogenase complex